MQVSTIGIDLAKNMFQVHGIYANEKVAFNKPLRRTQLLPFLAKLSPCLIGMEACASAHYWAREIKKLGHDVRLMPAKDVKAYVKRNKNDAADAAACCEAVRRPTVRTVPVKTPEQQAQLMQHRVRDLLVRQRTQAINALRSHMAELGIIAAQGHDGLKMLLSIIADGSDARLPENGRAGLSTLVAQIASCQAELSAIEKRLITQHSKNADSKRLETIPGIGVIGASAIVATVPDASIFKTGRDFAAWIGIVSREDSTGGKQRLGPISKQGDRYLRRLLAHSPS
jgi:transposase